MNKTKSLARWQLVALVVILATVIAGCANVRQGVSWPALEFVTINEQPRVLVIYDGQVEAIDPYQGAQVHVVRDEDGEPVRGSNGNLQEWVINGSDYNNAKFFAAPFQENGTFLFPTYTANLLEFDVNTAQIVNPAGIALEDGVLAEVVVTDDLIFVPYRQQDVVALDRETFQEVWRFDTLGGVWATPLLADGVLYVTSIDHNLYALNAEDGTPLWSEPVDLEGAVASTPLLYEGSLYVGGYSHKMFQVSLDGEITAIYEGRNWVWGTPVIVDDVLYYTDLNGYVYALNASNLTEIWMQRPSKRGIRPAPIVTENYVVVAARDGSVYWLDIQTGNTVQTAEIDGRPELLSDILYLPADDEAGLPELILVASTDNKRLVTALNMETFSPQWVYGR